MTPVVALAGSAPVAERLSGLGIDLLSGPAPIDAGDLLGRMPAGCRVALLDASTNTAEVLSLAAGVAAAAPGVAVVLLADPALALPALRAGVRDIVGPDATDPELLAAMDRAVTSTLGAVVSTPGRVVSVVSPKGGVGKTTVATNLAVGLARRDPGSTVVVDLDVQFGDVASALDLEPEYFLADTVRGAARNDPMVLKTFLTPHRTGLHVICAPDNPAEADRISAEDVGTLLQTLAREFRYVVVDTAPGLSELTLAALDVTTVPVLVSSMDVPGVRGLRKELETLDKLGLLPSTRQVVLNFVERKGLLSVADVEATIGTTVDIRLPRSVGALAAVNQGVPLLEGRLRDPAARQLDRLVTRIVGGVAAAAPPPKDATERAARQPRVQPRRALSRWRREPQAVAR